MKNIYCLFLLILLLACVQKKETEVMLTNIIERYGAPVDTDTLSTGILWYKFELDPSKANTESVKGTIDKSLNMLPTEMRGDKYELVSYSWESPTFLVHMENDFKGEIDWENMDNSNVKIIIKLWVTNK